MTGEEMLRALHARGCVLRVEGAQLRVNAPAGALEGLEGALRAWRDTLWTLHHAGLDGELARWPSWAREALRAERARLEAEGDPRDLARQLAVLALGVRYLEADDGTLYDGGEPAVCGVAGSRA